jgi:hypothetical protein
MIRLRHGEMKNAQGTASELILLNAHDGTSSYQLLSGCFRFVCSNGLFAGDLYNDLKVSHKGDALNKIIEGSYEIIDGTEEIADEVAMMQSLRMSRQDQIEFARAAEMVRYPENGPVDSPLADPSQLLTARRDDDEEPFLWLTMNKVEENLRLGGRHLGSNHRGSNGRNRWRSIGAVNTIDKTSALGKAMWSLASYFGQQKQAVMV